MELALRITAALPFTTLQNKPLFTRFPPTRFRETLNFHLHASSSTINHYNLSHQELSIKEEDYLDHVSSERDVLGSFEDDEEVEESSPSPYSLLSLSEKPDRNLALLDDYEMEEFNNFVDPNHKSGYVAVLGKPNVGKSTLANQLLGQKLSIVTDKPQTTRHRVLGICSGPDYQMILYDTPGVIEKKMHKLDSMMMKNVRSAATSADCVLVIVDACKPPQKIDEVLEEGGNGLKEKLPTLLVLNKKDLIKPGEIAKKIEVIACSSWNL